MIGSIVTVNRSMSFPLLIGGIEKKLFILNATLSFILIVASHFSWPNGLVGIVFFIFCQIAMRQAYRFDNLFFRLRIRHFFYRWRPYYPAKGSPFQTLSWHASSVAEVGIG